MKCVDREIARLLPWYVNRTLSRQEMQKVKDHLTGCAECRQKSKEMERLAIDMQKYGAELMTEHIASEQLVIYAEARSALNDSDRRRIEMHLASCEGCREELDILRQVDDFLVSKESRRRRTPHLIMDLFHRAHAARLLAYAAIILLLYPAWLGLYRLPQRIKEMQKPVSPAANFELQRFDSRAAETPENKIKLSQDKDFFSLSFTAPILTSDAVRHDAEITDAHGRVVWLEKNIKSVDGYGLFLLFCRSKFFRTGSYTLKLYEIDSRKNERQAFIFSFSIEKGKADGKGSKTD